MSIDTTLARLTAGLDRQERQALELCPGREPSNGTWRADSVALTALGDRKMAAFVADHSPADVLRMVEAIRKVIAEHADNGRGKCLSCSEFYAYPCPTLRALAGIYTEEESTND